MLQGTVMDSAATETDSIKIMSRYATAHVKLAAGHWLIYQGNGWGSVELSKFEYWILIMLAAIR